MAGAEIADPRRCHRPWRGGYRDRFAARHNGDDVPHAIPSHVRSVYLLPIGGTLAAPLAGLLKESGLEVDGSDLELYGPMKELVAAMGLTPKRGWDPANVPADVDLVLIGNAVPRTNPEVVAVLERDQCYTSMPEALRELVLAGRLPVVVTGTHGKTTTTSLVAWLLEAAGLEPGFLVGGIPQGFGTSHRLGRGKPFVVEGDEYNTAFFDRGAKFRHYAPHIAIVTHLEFDHGDIYPDLAAIEAQFAALLELVPDSAAGGSCVVCSDAPHARRLAAACRPDAITYGLGDEARFRAIDVDAGPSGTRFRLVVDGTEVGCFESPLSGRHNVQNAIAAIVVARLLGATWEQSRAGLASFQGVRRRLEERATVAGVTVIDDFAHHPTAIGETLAGALTRYGDRPIHVLFEPRSLTAGRSLFFDDYLRALDGAARVSIAPTFHLDRLPADQRLDFEALAAAMTRRGVVTTAHATIDDLVASAVAAACSGDVLLFMSSGSFGGGIERVIAGLEARDARGRGDHGSC